VFNFTHRSRELQTEKIRLVILNLSIIFKLGCAHKAELPVTKVFKTLNSFDLIPKHLYSLFTVRSKSEDKAIRSQTECRSFSDLKTALMTVGH